MEFLLRCARAAHLDFDLGFGAVCGHVHGRANLKSANDRVEALRHRRILCVAGSKREC